jgi:hypothetical protein
MFKIQEAYYGDNWEDMDIDYAETENFYIHQLVTVLEDIEHHGKYHHRIVDKYDNVHYQRVPIYDLDAVNVCAEGGELLDAYREAVGMSKELFREKVVEWLYYNVND